MTSIDEIMRAIDRLEYLGFEFGRGKCTPERAEFRAGLNSLIAAALADARREGAEAMREAAAVGERMRKGGA